MVRPRGTVHPIQGCGAALPVPIHVPNDALVIVPKIIHRIIPLRPRRRVEVVRRAGAPHPVERHSLRGAVGEDPPNVALEVVPEHGDGVPHLGVVGRVEVVNGGRVVGAVELGRVVGVAACRRSFGAWLRGGRGQVVLRR